MSRVDTSLILAGRAGQGIQLMSRVLGRALVRAGYHVFVSQDVMSRIRGGHNFSRIRVATEPVAADADTCDVVVALDRELLRPHLAELAPDGRALVDADGATDGNVVPLPMTDIADRHGGAHLANAVGAGAAMALLGADKGLLAEALKQVFGRKGAEVAGANVAAAKAGHDHMAEKMGHAVGNLASRQAEPRSLISGAEALALGAIGAGVGVVAGYPMSPGTPVLDYCARHATRAGILVEQTEDEIAAVNLAIGASFAGARAMVATAGGGFALMNEGLSLAGMTETPLVVCVGMRPGPGTGMATRTAQADLLTTIHAGHGEFPRVVMAPADALSAFQGVQRAFRLAETYQMPVLVLFDQFLGDALWTVAQADLQPLEHPPVTAEAPAEPFTYRRYALTAGGVSPRLVPGTEGQLVYADSDEHTEQGHITESAEDRVRQVDKRAAKLRAAALELRQPVLWPEQGAGNLAFCFGSTRGVVREAVARLREAGHDVAMVWAGDVWPFPRMDSVRKPGQRVFTVEGNYGAQLGQLLSQECRLRVEGSVRRYDGRQLRVQEVERGLGAMLGAEGDGPKGV